MKYITIIAILILMSCKKDKTDKVITMRSYGFADVTHTRYYDKKGMESGGSFKSQNRSYINSRMSSHFYCHYDYAHKFEIKATDTTILEVYENDILIRTFRGSQNGFSVVKNKYNY